MKKIVYLVADINNISDTALRRIAFWRSYGFEVTVKQIEPKIIGSVITTLWLDEAP